MSLWADKYRPTSLTQLDFHEDVSKRLEALASSGDFPHLLLYGPSGAGKKTRVLATLRELYGPSVEKLKVDIKTFTTSSNRKLEFNVISSPHHFEITPSDMGNNDRVVIQDLLKEIAQAQSIDMSGFMKNNNTVQENIKLKKNKFKIVIINEAELLTRDAQAALRRTMEKYSANIRLILICNSTSNIIGPIKSRTLLIRIPTPTAQEIGKVFTKILAKEPDAQRTYPSSESDCEVLFNNIANAAERNLRMSIMILETLYMDNDKITASTSPVIPDWALVIKDIARGIARERTVGKLQSIRTTLYELLAHAIPAKLILKKLTYELWSLIDEPGFGFRNKSQIKLDMLSASALFDERLSLGSKDIFHLEGFITKCMVIFEEDLNK